MSELMTMLIIVVCLVLLQIPVSFILWKMVCCFREISGSRFREEDRERQDLYHLIERLQEKRDVPVDKGIDMAALHAQERMNEVHHTADTEKRAQEVGKAGTNRREPVVSVVTDESAYQHQ